MCHPGPGPSGSFGTGPSLAVQSIQVEYFGHTSVYFISQPVLTKGAHRTFSAHASAAPWDAINALDAAFLAYSNVSVLRQQMKPDHRVHGIVEGKDWAPNSTLLIRLIAFPDIYKLLKSSPTTQK